jgi:DNA (cytosine-5)-methyltransferase 1
MVVGSLYAGVGGICLGFLNAGFKITWANEYDKHAIKTYKENFKHKLYECDVWDLNPEDVEKVDVLAAGFPCQPFSIAGYRKGFEDERGNHFFRITKFISVLQPKVVLLENVKNLVGHDKGNTFKVIKETLEEFNYKVYHKVLNTKDYTNIPQNRERIIVVAFKNDMEIDFTFPEPNDSDVQYKNVIDYSIDDERYFYRENKYNYEKLKEGIKKKYTFYQWRRLYVRENKSGVCPTLTANMGTGGHNVPLILTNDGIRKLTPRECFNLQGFPENFVLPNVSNSHLYKQSGNSVTVPLIEKVAKQIKSCLTNQFQLSSEKIGSYGR